MVTLRRCGSRYCQLTSGTPSPYPTTYPRTSASPLGGRQLTTTELEKAVVVTSIGCPGSAVSATVNQSPHRSWRRGGVRRMNEVNARLARLVLGWVTASSGGCTISACNQPTSSTQPCIPSGSLNRVPASAGVKAGIVTSVGWQVTLCDPTWHVNSSSCVAG